MALRKYTEFNPEGWTFGKIKNGKSNTVVTLDLGNLQVQTPVLTTVEDLNFSEPDLKFTYFKVGDDRKGTTFKEWLRNFDDFMVGLLDSNKEEIWGDNAGTMSKELIEEQFKNSISNKGKIKIYLNRDKNTKAIKLPIVDKDNKVLDITDIPCDTNILSIIRCRYIRVGASDISTQWEMLSVNVKEKKEDLPIHCILHDDTDSDDDFELIAEE